MYRMRATSRAVSASRNHGPAGFRVCKSAAAACKKHGNKKQEVNLLKHVTNNGREKVYLLKWYSGSLGDDNQIVHVRVKVRIC